MNDSSYSSFLSSVLLLCKARCTVVTKPSHEAAGAGGVAQVHSESDLLKVKEGKVRVVLSVTAYLTGDAHSCSLKVLPQQGARGSLTQLAQADTSQSLQPTCSPPAGNSAA